MDYNFRGHGIEVTPALKEHAKKKLGRLEKYFDHSEEAGVNVTMRVVKNQHIVEVLIPLPDVLLRAEVAHDDMYAAIDLVIDKLERQIHKYKTRIHRKARRENEEVKLSLVRAESPLAEEAELLDEEEELPYEVVRTKQFNIKPMDVEEAILQMEMLGHNFFIFTNVANNQISVVYKRNDEQYGLIEPQA